MVNIKKFYLRWINTTVPSKSHDAIKDNGYKSFLNNLFKSYISYKL